MMSIYNVYFFHYSCQYLRGTCGAFSVTRKPIYIECRMQLEVNFLQGFRNSPQTKNSRPPSQHITEDTHDESRGAHYALPK